ncbi:MAG: hypothetical protein RIS36_1406 [Pseudomonadota bacterium]
MVCCAALVVAPLVRRFVGVNLSEIVVIFLVALVLFGPEQLPVLARTLGKLTGQVKRTSESLRREFYNSVYTPGQEARNTLNGELQAIRNLKAEVLAPPTGAMGTASRPPPTEKTPERSPAQPSTPNDVPSADATRSEDA